MSPQPGIPAEEYALGVLRRHRDSMTRPDFQAVADDCGLYATQVERMWEQLLAGRTLKTLDRPQAVPQPSPRLAAVTAPPGPVEGSPPAWTAAKDHPSARIRGKYRRAVSAVADLENALAAELEKDKLRARKARLEEQLAKVKAELTGPPTAAKPSGVPTDCPKCGATFNGAHGLLIHTKRKPECR